MVSRKLKYFGIIIVSLFVLLVISGKTNSSLTWFFMGRDEVLRGAGDALLIVFVIFPLAILWLILFLYHLYKKYKKQKNF